MRKSFSLLFSTLTALILGGCMTAQPTPNTSTTAPLTITERPFGTTGDGHRVSEFTLVNPGGITVSILSFGGIVRSINVPDKNGTTADVVLGFDSLPPYEARHPYFGTITGRFANRIANGRFTLDGRTYTLATNNGPNHLHGGLKGFDRANWNYKTDTGANSVSLVLSHTSPDGDEGYPGAVSAQVTYTLFRDNSLRIDYYATSTKATPINLTNHSYFNLAGHTSGDVLTQKIQVLADKMVPVDANLIPNGTLNDVEGTPFDLREPVAIGAKIAETSGGYDHTFVLSTTKRPLHVAARAMDEESGRFVEVLTTEPGVQFYTGNFLNGSQVGKGGTPYNKHAGFCLETQHFPDSPNQPNFPSTILRPGEVYSTTTVMRFGAER
jgi:aldose 1-epimerase